MPTYLYAALAGESKISIFNMDPRTGRLEFAENAPLHGGPGPLTVDPEQRFLYAGLRSTRELSSFRIEGASGRLSALGTIPLKSDPCFLATDRTGRFLLSAYYFAGAIAVHRIGEDGALSDPPLDWLPTAEKAHSIQTDPSNRFAFVPHVMPANTIDQFEFDEDTGSLKRNATPAAHPPGDLGPRHFCFHPSRDIAYFVNEQGSSVTAYRFARAEGTLAPFQTVSTLPDGFDGENSCAQIHMAPSGGFLYASNRGHDSIAMFAIDAETGELSALGQQPTLETPRAFNLDPAGNYLFASSLVSGELASYRVDRATGLLAPLDTYALGREPMWVMILDLEG